MNVIIQKRTLPLAKVMASAHYQNGLILKVTTKAALVKHTRKGGSRTSSCNLVRNQPSILILAINKLNEFVNFSYESPCDWMFYFHSCVSVLHLMGKTHPTADLNLISEFKFQLFQGPTEEDEDKLNMILAKILLHITLIQQKTVRFSFINGIGVLAPWIAFR